MCSGLTSLPADGRRLWLSADAEPDDLYPSGDGAFEFERTASRLMEMRTHEYLAAERAGEIAE